MRADCIALVSVLAVVAPAAAGAALSLGPAEWIVLRLDHSGTDPLVVDVRAYLDGVVGEVDISYLQLSHTWERRDSLHFYQGNGLLAVNYGVRVRSDALAEDRTVTVVESHKQRGEYYVGVAERIDADPGHSTYYAVWTNAGPIRWDVKIEDPSRGTISNWTAGDGVEYRRVPDFDEVEFAVESPDAVVVTNASESRVVDGHLVGTFWTEAGGRFPGIHASSASWSGPAGRGDVCDAVAWSLGDCYQWFDVAGPAGAYDFRIEAYLSTEHEERPWLMTADVARPGPP